jgi:hypothetical protein
MPVFDPAASPLGRCRLAQGHLAQYRRTVNDLLACLGDPQEKASQAGDAYPFDPEEDPEERRAIELAIEHNALAVLESVRQSMLNLFAAGLFHLLEQLLLNICGGECPVRSRRRLTKLQILSECFQTGFNFRLEGLDDFDCMDELRLVANFVKHGASASELKKRNPELFEPYSFSQNSGEDGSVAVPLAGADLFIKDDDLKTYGDVTHRFLGQVASRLESAE